MKKLLYFLKIVLFQNTIYTIIIYLQGELVDSFEKNLITDIGSVLYAFSISLGISGFLFTANALCVIFIKKKILIYLMLTVNIVFYVFVFFEYVLDISGAFRELLAPTIFGVYGGVLLAMLEHKRHKKRLSK